MKKSSLLISAGLSLFALSAQANLHAGHYECARNGKVVRSITITSAKLGGVELPVVEIKNPITGSFVSGVATVYRTESATNYILTQNVSVLFEDSGAITSEDECRIVN